MKLEDLKLEAKIHGITPGEPVTVVQAHWIGTDAVDLTFKRQSGGVDSRLLYRDDEPQLKLAESGIAWAFNSNGHLFQLASEAYRIHLAYLFDPLLAVHTSVIEPLPHQITAVYEQMLPRQPLRYLLADDPGAGKTIMTGLLIKELRARSDLKRCLVVCPGMLAEQWQDEMWDKFSLPFEILTNQKIEAARTGNWFLEHDLVIARLDMLSRNEDRQDKLQGTDWDLIVVDEAHKMSAHALGNDVKYTKRYRLGQILAKITRHFLLLTATPHNGKEKDFQLFLSLLDGDRFAGHFREGVHTSDVSDLMRRLSKEQLVTFDNTPLFPERRAYTIKYQLSDLEAELYEQVTEYVREEFNRADRIENGGRRNTVGFALTSIQRRLASSPEAIYKSLQRRQARLERRLTEERLLKRGAAAYVKWEKEVPSLSDDALTDLEEAPSAEYEELEDRVIDQATASLTIAELEAEIETLKQLVKLAHRVRQSEEDKKWGELRELLQDDTHMIDNQGHRRKLVIFSEHRDTVNYLVERIRTLLGQAEAVVTIHGGMRREERRVVQERFSQDKNVSVLVATDAAGEGINLQRAHLMINYDLPWNPNRLEQRFGRIHRIGQTEVCHVWNMIADETREGDVFARLLEKIEVERRDLGGGVFDVMGEVFQGSELRELLIEAVRYGDRPEERARLYKKVDAAFDKERLEELVAQRALTKDILDASKVYKIKEEMERAEARRLQPYYIRSFFIEAFRHLGGTIREREHGRYEITHVPGAIRSRDCLIGTRNPVLPRYERVTFEKSLVSGKPPAKFVCPGHPLLDSVTDLILKQYRNLLKQGAIFIDPEDHGSKIRALFYLEHTIQDGRLKKDGSHRIISRRVQFSEINEAGSVRNAGYAPYLDYRPAKEEEQKQIMPYLEEDWLRREDIEKKIVEFAVENIVPEHVAQVKRRREEMVDKTYAAVKERLTKEITYWDYRAQQLKALQESGRQPRMNWLKARERADELQTRLRTRLAALEQEKQISPLSPVVIGGALVVPQGLLDEESGLKRPAQFARETEAIEKAAMDAVTRAERELGYVPSDVSAQNVGYDIESRDPQTGSLRFIEVKGRVKGAPTVTVTKNEILTALNKPDSFILAIVVVDGAYTECRYLRQPFEKEPDFGVTSVNYSLSELWSKGEVPG